VERGCCERVYVGGVGVVEGVRENMKIYISVCVYIHMGMCLYTCMSIYVYKYVYIHVDVYKYI